MVFPRNAGFGRCYLVSTRHEILSNIDRNLTGTRLRLRKNRNKINPARVRIPSQFHCCHLSLNCSALLSVVRISKTTLPSLTPEGGGGGGGGELRIRKGMGMLVVSLRGVNFGFWSHVGCSGQNAIIFSREGLV